jgi:SAM-dependent methyltransferase
MREIENQKYLREEQYEDASNLKARLALHEKFGIGARPWHLWVFDHLLGLPAECRILELGCGPGTLWAINGGRIPKGWDITLTDFSAGMLEEAKTKLAEVDHSFELVQVDAQDISFEDDTFDAVVANHMLYHVPDRPKAFSEIAPRLGKASHSGRRLEGD